jgi:tetratricopeptide (TPR) repeat protein
MKHDPNILNNYGSLLGSMGRTEEEVKWLEKALELQPDMEPALVNLAGYYQVLVKFALKPFFCCRVVVELLTSLRSDCEAIAM